MATFVRLLGWLRPYRRGVILSGLLAAVAMVMTVAIPWLTGRAIDRSARATRRGSTTLGLVVLAAGVLRLALTVARRLVAGRVSLGVELDLRNRMYGHLQGLELGFFDRQQTGQLMSRATVDLQAVRFFLGYGLVFILQSALDHPARRAAMFAVQPGPGGGLAHPRADRGLRLRALRPARAPGAAGAPAAHRRADRRRRGEHRRRARGQGLRARGPPARALPRARRARVGPGHGLHAHAGLLQPVHRLPAAARPGRDPLLRRAPGHRRAPDHRRVQRLLRLPAHAAVADAHARASCSASPSGPPRPAPASTRSSTASRGSSRRPARRRCRRARATCELRGVSLQYEGAVAARAARRRPRRARRHAPSRWSAPPARARRRSCSSSRACTTSAPARCSSTAPTCARSTSPRCAPRSPWSTTTPSSSAPPWPRTSPTRAPTRRARRSSSRRAAPRPTTSSRACPTATTRASASAG